MNPASGESHCKPLASGLKSHPPKASHGPPSPTLPSDSITSMLRVLSRSPPGPISTATERETWSNLPLAYRKKVYRVASLPGAGRLINQTCSSTSKILIISVRLLKLLIFSARLLPPGLAVLLLLVSLDVSIRNRCVDSAFSPASASAASLVTAAS